MRRAERLDGFQLTAGVASLAAGPVLLATGGPAGWSFLLIATGLLLLGTQWAIVNDIEFRQLDRATVLLLLVGLVAIAVAVVYLTRAADDLPSLFPGHDGDSERFRILPGVLIGVCGSAFVLRGSMAAHPCRAANHGRSEVPPPRR